MNEELVKRLRNEADRLDPPHQHEFNEKGQRIGHPGNVVMLLRKAADALTEQPAAEPVARVVRLGSLGVHHVMFYDAAGRNLPEGTELYTEPPAQRDGAREGMEIAAGIVEKFAATLLRMTESAIGSPEDWRVSEQMAQHYKNAAEAIRAEAAKLPESRAGDYVMVPREPTAEMLDAANQWQHGEYSSDPLTRYKFYSGIYRAMLHAAQQKGGSHG